MVETEKYLLNIMMSSYSAFTTTTGTNRRDHSIFLKLTRFLVDEKRKAAIMKETSAKKEGSFFSKMLG